MRRLIPLIACLALALPALGQPRPDARRAGLDGMLDALKAAPDETAAGTLETQIRAAWIRLGSPAAVLLLNRGERDLTNDAADEAVDDFDAALTLDPEYAEAYSRRALARFHLGDYPGALADIEQTLKREPRDFAALRSLSRIAESRADWRGALAAWRKALEIDPKMPEGADRLKELEKKAAGEGV